MRGRPAFLQHQAAQPLAVVVEQRRRTHGARDEDGVLRQLLARGRVVAPHQLPHQAVGEIVEVVQPVAQIRIGLPQHARAGVGLHALHRGFGGEAGHHRFVHAVHPALVIGEHAIGLEHVAMLAAVGDVAALQHHVEIGAHGGDGVVQALQFLLHVVGDEIGHHDARLVQHDMAERQAFGQCAAGHRHRMMRGRLCAGLGERGQLARGDHLRQHHGGGLQRFLFLFGIGAPRAVLHHQHAERVAGAQDRHAEEGVIDLFAGFRPVGEGRVLVRLRQIDGGGLARHQADQAFVDVHHGQVDGLPVQTFGGIELEGVVYAQHVNRTDLRHHVGGDQHHDLVQAFLRADRLRHYLAKPAQQHARTTERASHGVRSPNPIFPCLSRLGRKLKGKARRSGDPRNLPLGHSQSGMQTASQTPQNAGKNRLFSLESV